MLRKILSVLAGLVIAVLIIMGVEWIGIQLFPLPSELNMNDMESLRTHPEMIPLANKLFVLLAWAAGTFAGSWLATVVSKRENFAQGLIVGIILLVLAIINMSLFPHPIWFWIIGILLFFPTAYYGARTAI